jgi:hypothetical protein
MYTANMMAAQPTSTLRKIFLAGMHICEGKFLNLIKKPGNYVRV